MLKLEYRPRAQLDKESIAIYLGQECGSPQAALSTIREIDKTIERVREFPDSGGHVRFDTLERFEYRTALAGKYTAYYRFDSAKLVIYRILHKRQNIDRYTLAEL